MAGAADRARRVRRGHEPGPARHRVLIGPVRPALVVAKTVATLDVLSRGRVDLGIGTGWQREEFTDPALPFVGRTARMEDLVRACRAIWEQEPPVSFTSRPVAFTSCGASPARCRRGCRSGSPVRPSDATVRRVTELGDGWLPLAIPIDDVTATIERMRAAFAEAGRDPATLRRAPEPRGPNRRRRRSVDLAATMAPVEDLAARGITTAFGGARPVPAGAGDIEPFLRELGQAFA